MTASPSPASPPAAMSHAERFTANMAKVTALWQDISRLIAETQFRPDTNPSMGSVESIQSAYSAFFEKLMDDPGAWIEMGQEYWDNYLRLTEYATDALLGRHSPPVAEPPKGDRRFQDEAWKTNLLFDLLKQSYLLTSDWMMQAIRQVNGLDQNTARKVLFYTRQWLDALSPANYLSTNPEALRETLDSDGENLVRGMENLLADLKKGRGRLQLKTTDPDSFEVGRNLAMTPGQVIFENDLIQLIQYAPATEKVFRRPVLIIPAWINKYYILDLQPKNSLVDWLRRQGHTVFMISWANPDAALAGKSFDDYLTEGPLAAMDAIAQTTGETEIQAIGYCLGGTLLSIMLSWLAARGEANRIASATFLTTLTDFSEAGDLSVFVDEEQLGALDTHMREHGGYLPGRDMALTFSMLRANDMIWSFMVNNYLLGKEPFPFDLLYWNSDATRMPARMHSFYLRHMYLQNDLIKPGELTIAGETIDLTRIETPCYMMSTREDHIAPWKSTYAATHHFRGPLRFVLAASGHVAGVVNPPAKEKYCFWARAEDPSTYPDTPEEWLQETQEHPGSWWPDWHRWAAQYGGGDIPARDPEKGGLPPLEPAPGRYVRVKEQD